MTTMFLVDVNGCPSVLGGLNVRAFFPGLCKVRIRTADGGWRMADGGRRMADGGRRTADNNKKIKK